MHVYTMKKNAVRAAKKAGLTAENVVHQVDGGFVVEGLEKPAAESTAAAPKAAKVKKAPKAKAERKAREKAAWPREGTKNAKLLALLTRDGGATAAQLEAALGWKQPTIRTAIQRVCPAYGLEWRHVKGEDGAKSRWEASRKAA